MPEYPWYVPRWFIWLWRLPGRIRHEWRCYQGFVARTNGKLDDIETALSLNRAHAVTVLCRAYERRVIDSEQMHTLAAMIEKDTP